MDKGRTPFPSILVSPRRGFQTPCSTATVTPTSIRSTQEVAFLGSPFERELQYNVNASTRHMDTGLMTFPGIFVSPIRDFKTTRSTAKVTPTCIRLTQEVAFLGSVLKTEVQNTFNSPCEQVERARMEFPSLFVSLTCVFKNTSCTDTGTTMGPFANR